MLIVSDTSPLNYLVQIGQESILPSLFGQVVTVPAVVAELSHPRSLLVVRAWVESPPAWLRVLAPKSLRHASEIDLGEAQAISLAEELQAAAVLIDDRRAVAVARSVGLTVVGTLLVLEQASTRGLVRLAEVIEALRHQLPHAATIGVRDAQG